jgi:predicted ribosomally synthesized peptide with SipW-like signal peptide
MSDEFDISRRKVLGGLTTIGVAGAAAGFGTSAYFSDQETFENNSLIAGELDMKVGWENHYSDWSDDENDGLEGDVVMEHDGRDGGAGSTVDSTRVGLPSNVAALISVMDADDAMTFLDNTLENQYPADYRAMDLPDAINCDDPILADDDDADAAPVIELDDVKPGDFGEVTFSFALCDNPGYVWAGAFLEDASENGITEPEAEDEDEEETEPRPASEDSDDDIVELLDELQVAVWLDNGNNFQGCGEQPLTVGSLRGVINGDAPNIANNGLRLDGRNVDGLSTDPGNNTELTAYSVRCAPASGSSSGLAFGKEI